MIAKFKILPQESTESSVDIFLFHRHLLLLPWPHEPFLSFSASPLHEPPFAVVPAPPCNEPLPCFSFLNPEKNGVAPHNILLTLSLFLCFLLSFRLLASLFHIETIPRTATSFTNLSHCPSRHLRVNQTIVHAQRRRRLQQETRMLLKNQSKYQQYLFVMVKAYRRLVVL